MTKEKERTTTAPLDLNYNFGPYEMFPDGLHCNGAFLTLPFEVIGHDGGPDGNCWGLWLRWWGPDGRSHTHRVSDGNLHKWIGAMCTDLERNGFRIAPGRRNRNLFVAYLNAVDCPQSQSEMAATGVSDRSGGRDRR